MKIAYLTNRYPAVSHTFIRRELLELERFGHAIKRCSIRPGDLSLPDEADRGEQHQTYVILEHPADIVASMCSALALSPVRSARALQFVLAGRPNGLRSLFRRVAYFAEGCFLAKWLRSQQTEHLHVHFGTNPTAVARVARLMGGPPYSFTVHGPDEFDRPEELALGGKVADASFAVAISSYGRSQLQRWSDLDDWSKIAVVRCGVDQTFLSGMEPSSEGLSSKRLCFVGRLAPQKGLPLLIQAAAALRSQGEEFELIVVGEGPLRAELESQIERLKLTGSVRLLGAKDAPGVREAILSSRATVLPSFAEGLPVVLMESLALNRPVITTAIAGIPELVDAECGWLVPAGSVDALTKAMADALSATMDRLQSMGAEGHRRVAEQHDASKNAAALLELIKQAHQPVIQSSQ